jgi:hypothetical protein
MSKLALFCVSFKAVLLTCMLMGVCRKNTFLKNMGIKTVLLPWFNNQQHAREVCQTLPCMIVSPEIRLLIHHHREPVCQSLCVHMLNNIGTGTSLLQSALCLKIYRELVCLRCWIEYRDGNQSAREVYCVFNKIPGTSSLDSAVCWPKYWELACSTLLYVEQNTEN